MDAIIDSLAVDVVAKYHEMIAAPTPRRLVVGIAGLPGSGKSTVAVPLIERVNDALGPVARCVALDGWHLPRAELDKFPDPAEAHFRRGAPFTFDVRGYAAFVSELRTNFTSPIAFPTFEHEVKDPIPTAQPIREDERIVVVEGLYTLLTVDEWSVPAKSLDLTVFVEIDRERARQRCIERNWAARLTATKEQTIARVDKSDMVNGDLVLAHSVKPTHVIHVVEDAKYAQPVA